MSTTATTSSGVGLAAALADQDIAYRFLQHEAVARGFTATVLIGQAAQRGNVLTLPVHVEDAHLDVLEVAESLQSLEDSWNTQEPLPILTLILRPVNP